MSELQSRTEARVSIAEQESAGVDRRFGELCDALDRRLAEIEARDFESIVASFEKEILGVQRIKDSLPELVEFRRSATLKLREQSRRTTNIRRRQEKLIAAFEEAVENVQRQLAKHGGELESGTRAIGEVAAVLNESLVLAEESEKSRFPGKNRILIGRKSTGTNAHGRTAG